MTYTQRELTDRTSTILETGSVDSKGRKIGIMISKALAIYTPHDANWGYSREPGTCYALRIQGTRDGVIYGATQPVRVFDTAAERQAKIDKVIAQKIKA
jgi:hypothetical protein